MTAFAAILHKNDDAVPVDPVARALADVTGRAASASTAGRCVLLVSPLHANDSPAPVRTPSGQLTVGSRTSEFGEYACASWNPGDETLECSRDGLGIRLLYVAAGEDTIVVTNVLAAALCHPRIAATLDEAALIEFLAYGTSLDHARTCYRDVRVLPPGHTLTIDGRSFTARMRRHWTFPVADEVRRTAGEIVDEYRSLLADAVRDRLGSDGTSIFLSGGIDSTTMAAAAVDVAPPRTLHAITTRYPRYVDDVELPFTQAAAERLGLPLTIVDADAHAPWHQDAETPPLSLPLDEPMLADWRDALTCAAQHGTVALYGEDGDALLRPPGWRALRNAASLGEIGLAAAHYALTHGKRPYIGLRWRERMGIVRPRRFSAPPWLTDHARTILDDTAPADVLGCRPEPLPPHPTRPEAQAVLTSTTIARHFAATIAPETTRRRVELRFPILDLRLVRLVVSIPAIPWCQDKALPRRAYRGRLPDAVIDRPKTPLVGFNEGMVDAWRRSTGNHVATLSDPVAGWIDGAAWAQTLRNGAPGAVMAAWRVSALDAWLAGRSRPAGDAACTR